MRTSARWIPLSMLLLAPLTAAAQEPAAPAGAPPAAPAPAPAPAPAEVVAAPAPAAAVAAPAPAPVPYTWEALADMYYMYNFTGKPMTQAPIGRAFDQTSDNFALNYAKLGVGVDTEFVAFRLDLGAGHTAAIINSTINGSATPAPGTTASPLSRIGASDFLIQQAFGTWKISKDLTFDVGRFVTTAGAEVIESNKNWLYSRSFLFNGIPFLHNGVRLNYAATPALKLQASIVNGWNFDVDNNLAKTLGLSAAFTPPDSDNTAVILTSYIGREAPGAGGDYTFLVDVVGARDFGKASLNLNFDYYKLGDAWWGGAALMGRYLVTDQFNIAARGEYIKSKKGGYSGLDTAIYEVTAMAGYVVAKHFELRAEVRGDLAGEKIYNKGGDPRKNQVTGTLAALTYF